MAERTRPDRLSALIQRFRVKAQVLPGRSVTATEDGTGEVPSPNLFIIGAGRLRVSGGGLGEIRSVGPALIYFPCGAPADLVVATDPVGAEYVSAAVDTGGTANPIALSLPDTVVLSLDEARRLEPVSTLLLDEALTPRCGGQAVIDRLCEIVVIRLLRHLIEEGDAKAGLVAGLAHPNLSLAIVAMHDHPGRNWRIEDLAGIAAMSRTHFINSFRDVVGVTPGEYLSSWRLTLARIDIAAGVPLKTVVRKVGFSSSAALSRAFKRRFGVSPRQDLVGAA